jgi:hypothetical protein
MRPEKWIRAETTLCGSNREICFFRVVNIMDNVTSLVFASAYVKASDYIPIKARRAVLFNPLKHATYTNHPLWH